MAHRRIPSLNWLRVFEAAARTENFAAAARQLNMTPSAVSQQISALESHLKQPLFLRGPKQVTLTEAGRLLLPSVREALFTVEASISALFDGDAGDRVVVEAPTVLASGWLAPRLSRFHAAQPDVRVTLTCADSIEAARGRDTGMEPDVRITFGPSILAGDDAAPLFSETVFPVARPELSAALATRNDLLRHRLIDVAGHRRAWLQLLDPLGPDIAETVRFTNVETSALALHCAAAGAGVALARAPATDWLVETLGLVRCLETVELSGAETYYIALCGGRRPARGAVAFYHWARAEVQTSSGSTSAADRDP